MISVVILTKNEEANIGKCLASIRWCDEIIVVDDYSEDKRIMNHELRIKDNKRIKIFRRHLEGDFASQRNYGLSKAKGDWVLFVDADEIVSEELEKEILSTCYPRSCRAESISSSYGILKQVQDDNNLLEQNKFSGYYLKRSDYFLGRWLKYGETGNIKLLRLARREAGNWYGKIHEVWQIEGKVSQLDNPLLHYPHKDTWVFLLKINWYTDIVAQYWKEQGREITFWQILLYPLGKFIHNYLVRRGFLDGVPGLIMALMMSFHSFLTRGKLWLSIKNFKKKNNGNSV